MTSDTHSAGVVHQFKVGLSSFLPPFRLEEVGGLAQVVVKQSSFDIRWASGSVWVMLSEIRKADATLYTGPPMLSWFGNPVILDLP